MQKIIGVVGLKGAGKDTIGKFICDKYNYKKVAFADKLKDIVSILFDWDRAMLEGDTPEHREEREKKDNFWSLRLEKDFTPRMALQQFGTEVIRNHFNNDFWVHCLERKIVNNPDTNFVITDVRFPNEIKMIKKLGGQIIRVERGDRPLYWSLAEEFNTSGIDTVNGKFLPLLDVHPSERMWIGIDKPDLIVENNGTIEELYEKIENYLK